MRHGPHDRSDADRALLTQRDTQSRHYDLLSHNGQWKTLADG